MAKGRHGIDFNIGTHHKGNNTNIQHGPPTLIPTNTGINPNAYLPDME